MAELSKEMQASIDNYGKQIVTLKDFVSAVRKLPGMYIGMTGYKGFRNMCREIFQNSIDQILSKDSPGNWFSFFYDMRTLEVRVEDNGKGLPPDDIIRILTTNHTSKNFQKQLYDYSSGLHGSGSKIVNALSSVYIVESYKYDGTAVRMEFHQGYPTTKAPVKIPNKSKKQGLMTYFIPDQDVMGENLVLHWEKLYNLIKIILSLTPVGSRCDFEAIDLEGKSHKETIINKDGIITDLIMKSKNPIIKPIICSADDGTHKLDFAFAYDAGDDSGPDDAENITAFANFCPTIGGYHIDGCLDGICRWFMTYMNNVYLVNQKAKDKIKVNSSDIKTGLVGIVSAAHLEPVLTGQSKELLSNEDMFGFCKEVVQKGLDEWSKANPTDLAKLSKFFKEIAEIRMKNENSKAKIVQKFQKNATNDLPKKYVRPLQDKNVEFIVVEGDSALNTVKLARDPDTQGIMPIRGKIINVFSHNRQEVFANQEVQEITQIILGGEYKRNFTLDDVKVSKVIFMADADVDGSHIAALLLRLFVMYFPQLIEAGMVYKALPPLYSIKEGKKTKFFIEQIDIVKFIQKDFLAKNTFLDMKKKALDNKSLTKFFLKNADYIYYLTKVANTYAVDPNLLEVVLYNYIENNHKIDAKKLTKVVKSLYRFMNVETSKSGYVVLKGSIAESNLIICHDKFFNDCRDIIRIIESNDSLYYLVNNKPTTLYHIMLLYEKSTP